MGVVAAAALDPLSGLGGPAAGLLATIAGGCLSYAPAAHWAGVPQLERLLARLGWRTG